jgi:hypothetical protein
MPHSRSIWTYLSGALRGPALVELFAFSVDPDNFHHCNLQRLFTTHLLGPVASRARLVASTAGGSARGPAEGPLLALPLTLECLEF